MEDKIDRPNKYNEDLLCENRTNSNKIYNYLYVLLTDKNDNSFLEL